MKPFIHGDFLLGNATARRLFHDVAAPLPIVDYHCHLDPRDLATDRRFENLAELWVTGDPYKHRAMRIAGVPEADITGPAAERLKFGRWAETVPLTLGNPLYAWSALELYRCFGIGELLGPVSAGRIWDTAAAQLAKENFTARGLLRRFQVETVCTSDRLLDDFAVHALASKAGQPLRVLPSLRADEIVAPEAGGFAEWTAELGRATRIAVSDWDSFRAAVRVRLEVLATAGCRLSDHGLDDFVYVPTTDDRAATLLGRRLRGETLAAGEAVELRSALLRFLGAEYAARGWLMQLHLGAQRRTSSRLRRLAGPAGGYAAIGRTTDVASLCAWFDELEAGGDLPRVILYPLNPADFEALAVLTGSFAEDGVAGKIQLGPAWWFNDHEGGMRRQLDAVAQHGLLATFIGMTTDSRSLLSLSRHEYFRRVLCDYIGTQVERGAWPADHDLAAGLVRRIAYGNAAAALAAPSSLQT